MSNIDWSQAPIGYDFHFQPKQQGHDGAFYAVGRIKDRFVSLSGGYILFSDMHSVADLYVVTSRPAAVTPWTGEGLPPVGAIVDIRESYSIRDESKCFLDSPVTVAATFKMVCGTEMVAVDGGVGRGCDCFRADMCKPIRTPEQIAAEKREKGIAELLAIAITADPNSRDVCAALYDAGYRKN